MNPFVLHLMRRNKCSRLQAEALAAKIWDAERDKTAKAKAARSAAQLPLQLDTAPQSPDATIDEPLPF